MESRDWRAKYRIYRRWRTLTNLMLVFLTLAVIFVASGIVYNSFADADLDVILTNAVFALSGLFGVLALIVVIIMYTRHSEYEEVKKQLDKQADKYPLVKSLVSVEIPEEEIVPDDAKTGE